MGDFYTDDDKQQQLYNYLQGQQDSAGGSPIAPAMPLPQQADQGPSGPPPVDSSMPAAQPDKSSEVADYLKQKYADANDDSGVKAARQTSGKANLIANIAQGLDTIGRSNAVAHGGEGVNTGFYQGLKQQGQQGVEQAQAARQAKVQQFLQQNTLNRQVAEDAMQKGTYDQQQKAAGYLNDRNDPTSQVSKNAVASAHQTFGDFAGIDNVIKPGMSAVEVDDALKALEKKSSLDNAQDIKKMQLQYQQDMVGDKRNQKQDQVYTDLNDKVVNFRGNQSVQRAAMGVGSAKRALDLIAQYPDPNKMPADKFGLLNTEIAAVATGGVPTEGSVHNITADTFQSNYSKFLQKVGNQPTGAQLGAFIGQNKAYLQEMMKTNQGLVQDYQRSIYTGRKSRISPEQDAEFQRDHPEIFGKAAPEQAPQAAAPGPVPAFQHPDAGAAAAWAKANPNDPRSAEILKRLGDKNAGL